MKRYWWLINLIRQHGLTKGAEVGCANGATTGKLLTYCPDLVLYAVDKWEKIIGGPEAGDMRNNDPKYAHLADRQGCTAWDPVAGEARFDKAVHPYAKRLVKLKGDSVEMAQHVEDESLDFVFIDADHRYQGVKGDLEAWMPKVKPGGWITGHDVHLRGVKRALDELVPDYVDTGIDHVWAIQKQ